MSRLWSRREARFVRLDTFVRAAHIGIMNTPSTKPSPDASQIHRLKRPPTAILTLLLLIAGVEMLLSLAETFGYGSLRIFCFAKLAFNSAYLTGTPPLYEAQPWVMFFSHALLHIGSVHMLGNLLTLYLLWYLMPWMYISDFVVVFWVGALGGALGFLWLAPPGSLMTGASGAVAGLAAVWGLYEMFLVQKGHILSIRPKWTAVLMGLVTLGLLLRLDQQLGMAWQTHLGGALAGAGFGAGLIMRAIQEG